MLKHSFMVRYYHDWQMVIIKFTDSHHYFRVLRALVLSRSIYIMYWLIGILLFLFLIICWLLIAPLVMIIDTTRPIASIKWVTLGSAKIWYEEEWWVSMRIPFYRRTWRLADLLKKKPIKKVEAKKKSPSKKLPLSKKMEKFWFIIKSFRVRKWQLAIDTGNPVRNAQLYPLNFYPGAERHILVNFNDDNFLILEIVNRPLKMIIAFLR